MRQPSDPALPSGRLSWRTVRLWQFIALPAVAMALLLIVSRVVEGAVPALGRPEFADLYQAVRMIVISAAMASVVAALAVAYTRQYEARLRARNEDLTAARDLLASVIEGSGEAIIALDERDRVSAWNKAAERIYGWSAQEMIGQAIERVLPPEPAAREEWDRVREMTRAGRTLQDHETTRVRKDGRRILVRITRSQLYDSGGRYVGSTGIERDVTELAQMEVRLMEQERLAAVGELAAQVAHEIRNPLAGIRGACDVIFSRYHAGDPQQEIGAEVLRQIDRLNRTVEDLLEFANPRSIMPAPTDLHGLLDRVIGLLHEDPDAGRVSFARHYAAAVPPLEIDAHQIEQVFFNVLLNACQAMDYEGTITVCTARDDGRTRVTVRDSGPGIPPERLTKIFAPFFTTRAQGTGLGLAIVRKIVRAHGGTVTAGDAPGGGAEFRIDLPDGSR